MLLNDVALGCDRRRLATTAWCPAALPPLPQPAQSHPTNNPPSNHSRVGEQQALVAQDGGMVDHQLRGLSLSAAPAPRRAAFLSIFSCFLLPLLMPLPRLAALTRRRSGE